MKQDVKYVAKRILGALGVLHEDNFAETGNTCFICFHINHRVQFRQSQHMPETVT